MIDIAKFCLKCGAPMIDREVNGEARVVCSSASCDYVFWNNPVPVVAGLVKYQGSIVLIQNVGWPEDWYGLVTGYLEKNESPEEGIIREVKEEINLDAKVERWIGNYIFTQKNEIIMAYYLTAQGEIQMNEEINDYKLVPPDQLKPWPFATGLAAAQWLKDEGISNQT